MNRWTYEESNEFSLVKRSRQQRRMPRGYFSQPEPVCGGPLPTPGSEKTRRCVELHI